MCYHIYQKIPFQGTTFRYQIMHWHGLDPGFCSMCDPGSQTPKTLTVAAFGCNHFIMACRLIATANKASCNEAIHKIPVQLKASRILALIVNVIYTTERSLSGSWSLQLTAELLRKQDNGWNCYARLKDAQRMECEGVGPCTWASACDISGEFYVQFHACNHLQVTGWIHQKRICWPMVAEQRPWELSKMIKRLLHNLVEASFDLFRYLLLGV